RPRKSGPRTAKQSQRNPRPSSRKPQRRLSGIWQRLFAPPRDPGSARSRLRATAAAGMTGGEGGACAPVLSFSTLAEGGGTPSAFVDTSRVRIIYIMENTWNDTHLYSKLIS